MKTKALIKNMRIQSQITPIEYDDKLFNEAADRLEMLSVMSKKVYAKLSASQAECRSMASTLKKLYGCGGCAHCNCDFDQEPCESCRKDGNFPAWEWKGENHEE